MLYGRQYVLKLCLISLLTPYCYNQTTSYDESTRESASQVGVHVIRGDFVVALRWSYTKWDDESKLSKVSSGPSQTTQSRTASIMIPITRHILR